MNLLEAERNSIALMKQWGVCQAGYSFRWMRTKRLLGRCSYEYKLIELSQYFVEINEWPVVEQVVLHEIAHAMTPGHKHDRIWQRVALRIGVLDPKSRSNVPVSIKGRYEAECPNCKKLHYRHRLSSRMNSSACSDCCKRHNRGKYSEQFRLFYKDTLLTVVPERSSVTTNAERKEIKVDSTANYSAPALAQKIGIDAKTLRRFLRENESFRNPGSGGRYTFTESEAASVERAFKVWNAKRVMRNSTVGETTPTSKTERAKKSADAKGRAKERVDALENSLRARGVHISQYQGRA